MNRRPLPFAPIWNLILALAAMIALAGCTAGSDLYFGSSSVKDAEKIVADADWDKATRIKVDIRQNEFRPAIMRLYVGEPYIVSFENRDDSAHSVSASEFFGTIAMRQLVEKGEVRAKDVRLYAIGLEPGETKEIHFVPTLDGWYQYSDGASALLFWSRGEMLGTVGAIIVAK